MQTIYGKRRYVSPVVIVRAGHGYHEEIARLGMAETLDEAKAKARATGYSIIHGNSFTGDHRGGKLCHVVAVE